MVNRGQGINILNYVNKNITSVRKIDEKIFVHQKSWKILLKTGFCLHNIHLEFSTCPHKFKWILSTIKTVITLGIKIPDYKWSSVFKLKSKNSLHKNEFLALSSFRNKSYAKIYIIFVFKLKLMKVPGKKI